MKLLFVLLFLFASSAHSLDVPKPGQYDKRVKFVDYNAAQVVKLVGHYGFSTHIQLSPTENVQHIAMGDKDAWTIAPIKNNIFIKPKGKKATTNMTVITSRRVYNFVLSAHWSKYGANSRDMSFQINFKYPEDEAKYLAAQKDAEALQERLNTISNPSPTNWDYWSKGSSEVLPTKAFDDGRFIYLSFSHNSEMPAIYTVNHDGTESLVNTHIDPQNPSTIVIHKLSRKLVLRKGKSVGCIVNKSYPPSGRIHKGNKSDAIERTIKGKR